MNAKNGMMPVHPGEIAREELDALGLPASSLSKATGISARRIELFLGGETGATNDLARKLAGYFDTTTELWLNLQKTWEARQEEVASRTSAAMPQRVG